MSRMHRLAVVLGLNLALVSALLVVGITARSLAVLAEGGDYLLDAAGVAVAMFAIWLSARPPSAGRPAGRKRRQFSRSADQRRLAARTRTHRGRWSRRPAPHPHTPRVRPRDSHDEQDLPVAAVLLDTIADATAAAGVAITGAIILATGGLYWLDPAVALLIAAVISWHAVALIRKVILRHPRRRPAVHRRGEEERPRLG